MKRDIVLMGIVALAPWVSVAQQTNCSHIAGQCPLDPGASSVCGSNTVSGTQVTYHYNCYAACEDTSCPTPTGYPAQPSSLVKQATGQCGKVASGSLEEVPDRVNCPPLSFPPTVANAPNHPGRNEFKVIFQNMTQNTPSYNSCNGGSYVAFISYCDTRPCTTTCPTNLSCNFDPSSYCPQDPCVYTEYPHCPVGWILDAYSPMGECCLNPGSPLIIDTEGDGIALTDTRNGVRFDILATGTERNVAWTTVGADDAWLVLDRNTNGKIDDGSELFGNKYPQPISSDPNGFVALAEYDRLDYNGNEDGVISQPDAVWTLLRLWKDVNHNGVSEPDELEKLETVGIRGFELKVQEKRWKDDAGNHFRYRAQVLRSRSSTTSKWIYDVYLLSTK